MYRSNIEIAASVLESTRQRTGITAILHNANIPHPRAKKLLSALVSKGLVEQYHDQYVLSSSGFKFLDEHNKYKALAADFGLML